MTEYFSVSKDESENDTIYDTVEDLVEDELTTLKLGEYVTIEKVEYTKEEYDALMETD